MMAGFMAIFILAISPMVLLQFFTVYCHSLIAKSRGYDLSEQGREISGVTSKAVRGDQFKRLLQLIDLCPEHGEDNYQLRAVSAYFRMLGFVRVLLSRVSPAAAIWIESERGGCAYAAAVELDRRIAYSRILMARQAVPLR
jgi:hypothetical protein